MKNLPSIDYRALFRSAPGLYLILLPDLTIVEVSDAYAAATMTQRENITGKKLFDVFPDNPDDYAADGVLNLNDSLNYVLRHKKPHTLAVQKYDIRKPDGQFEVRYWSPMNQPVLNDEHDIMYIIHRVEDVTDFIRMKNMKEANETLSGELQNQLKRTEIEIFKRSAEIQKLNSELEAKVDKRTRHLQEANETIRKNMEILSVQKEQLQDFCNIISHNLRAPLVNIGMLIDMLAEKHEEEEKQMLIGKLNTVTSNLSEIFNELIESLQVRQDTTIPSEKLVIQEYVQRTTDGLQAEINKLGAIIETSLEDAPVVYYPVKYLTSILHNLISNALKYRSPERKPVIRISTRKTGDKIVLSVSDNGLGIDLSRHRDQIFKIRKVFHSHPDAKGFGLFITKSQVVAMDGRIWVESTPGTGSTFFIEFKNQEIS